MAATDHEPRGADLRVASLRSQLPAGVLAFGREQPRLTWTLTGASEVGPVGAYEVQAAADPEFGTLLGTSGVVESAAQVGIPAPAGRLRSRELRHYRVRVRSRAGWTPWSETLALEAGLLSASDWLARPITPRDDPGRNAAAPAPYLRREVVLAGPVAQARLHVTSHGVSEVRINGRRVGDHLLAPGWTSYDGRLLTDTHDVTALLVPGANALGAILGDGWYRGRLGWNPVNERCRYGDQVALLLQLEVELVSGQRVTVVSDEHWRAGTGSILAADLYDGATVDLRHQPMGWDEAGFDDSAWDGVATVPLDRRIVEPRMSPPVRVVETRPVDVGAPRDGVMRLDTGQNLAGWLRLRVRGAAGDRVVVRHAEVREPDGALHLRSLRTARATDEFVLAGDGETVLEPPFTFHGFRHADVETTATLVAAQAVAISSDLRPRSSFACSHDALNRLHANVAWSQRGNFVSIPTDCPQRDERLGWTGDAQAFAATACTLFDSAAFWQEWLRDLDLDQDDRLGVPSVVPDVVLEGEARYGRAGWADAATIVPWAVYESYGDPEVLARQLGSMRRWVTSLVLRQDSDGLLPASFQFGDWLDPDAPPDRPWEAKADSDFIANAFFAHSVRLFADAAALLGEATDADAYGPLARRLAARTWERWGEQAIRTQTGCAIALQLGIAPERERAAVGAALARLVDEADGRVATGFLGTPLVLPALAATGHWDQAYRMLLRTDAPSWLYQVNNGATTVWERWDAIRPDGSIHDGLMAPMSDDPGDTGGHMLSFNHYAYGAVIDWVYRHVAGLAPDRDRPGYALVRFAPRPAAGVAWAQAEVDGPYGRVRSSWRLERNELVVDATLPLGSEGVFTAPATASSTVSVDGAQASGGEVVLGPGEHRIVVTDPAVAGLGAWAEAMPETR